MMMLTIKLFFLSLEFQSRSSHDERQTFATMQLKITFHKLVLRRRKSPSLKRVTSKITLFFVRSLLLAATWREFQNSNLFSFTRNAKSRNAIMKHEWENSFAPKKKKIKNVSRGSGVDEEEGRCPTELLLLVNGFFYHRTTEKNLTVSHVGTKTISCAKR